MLRARRARATVHRCRGGPVRPSVVLVSRGAEHGQREHRSHPSPAMVALMITLGSAAMGATSGLIAPPQPGSSSARATVPRRESRRPSSDQRQASDEDQERPETTGAKDPADLIPGRRDHSGDRKRNDPPLDDAPRHSPPDRRNPPRRRRVWSSQSARSAASGSRIADGAAMTGSVLLGHGSGSIARPNAASSEAVVAGSATLLILSTPLLRALDPTGSKSRR
jgi:hypothetical protein